jgi:hypothetical protein
MSSATPFPQRSNRLERETIITFNESEPHAVLWTASLKEVAKWAAQELTITPANGGWRTLVPKQRVQIRRAYRLSPEKLESTRARLATARAKRQANISAAKSQTNQNAPEAEGAV